MKHQIIVLGAGLVGRAIAIDLKNSGHKATAVGEPAFQYLTDHLKQRGVNYRMESLSS